MSDGESGDRPSGEQVGLDQHAETQDQAGQRAQRLTNLASLVERGFEAYPYSFESTHTAAALRASHADLQPGARATAAGTVPVAGRRMLKTRLGKPTFGPPQCGASTR